MVHPVALAGVLRWPKLSPMSDDTRLPREEQARPTALVFSLTGGIGSGKSTVSAAWQETGVPVVDADQLARRVVAPGSQGLQSLVETFGERVLAETGELNRPVVAQLVFQDDEARERLNAIVHPLVRSEAEKEFSRLAAQGHRLICYEVPLLFETGQQERFRPVVVVSVPENAQLSRTMKRDDIPEQAARARVGAQLPLHEKAEQADYVIDNTGTPEETKKQALAVLERIRERAPV